MFKAKGLAEASLKGGMKNINLIMIDTKRILSQSIDRIAKLLVDLEECKLKPINRRRLNNQVIFDEIKKDKLINKLDSFKNIYVYVIVIAGSVDALSRIKKDYEKFNRDNKPRILGVTINISKYNEKHSSKYLYVGISRDLRNRIKQHLGYGNKRTYSLGLRHWFPEGIDLDLEIYQIDSKNQTVLETIEQSIWDSVKPIFGKRSGR